MASRMPGWVQSNSKWLGNAQPADNVSSIAVTLGATVTSGNLIIAAVTWGYVSTDLISNVTDDKSNTYSLAVKYLDTSGDNQNVAIYYKYNVTNAPITVTVSLSSPTAAVALVVFEVSYIETAHDPLDGAIGNHQTGTPPETADGVTSGAIVTRGQNEYIFAASFDSSGDPHPQTLVAGTGYTPRESHVASGSLEWGTSEDMVQTVAGSVAGTFTLTLNGATAASKTTAMAAFYSKRSWLVGAR